MSTMDVIRTLLLCGDARKAGRVGVTLEGGRSDNEFISDGTSKQGWDSVWVSVP